MSHSAATLRHLELPGIARFEDASGGLVRLVITSPAAEAHVFLQGAHIVHFQARGERPLLFTSRESLFAPGKAIRGGVPICFPWFGPRAGEPKAPSHGFARTSEWQIDRLQARPDGGVDVIFQLESNAATRAVWPHEFRARYHIGVGEQLELRLEVTNTSSAPISFEDALHTYLAVADVKEVSIIGLTGTEFVDKVDGGRRKTESSERIQIRGEVDRVYLSTAAACTVEDHGAGRQIRIEKSGSDTTVVWNPWIEKAVALPDLGDDEWPHFVCIETANAADNAVTLRPGESHTTIARFPTSSVEGSS